MKRLLFPLLVLCLCLTACAPQAAAPASGAAAAGEAAISFVDDEGRAVALDAPCRRIISLYSAHTENLYSLGVGDSVIGAHGTSVYPAEAAFLPRYDYNGDPERVIAAEPDCVLIRPFITRKAPEFVRALENAGLTVVSLYPETLDGFEGYIRTLALLTGAQDEAEAQLAAFWESLGQIQALTAQAGEPQGIFFESTEVNLRTVTPHSMAGLAMELAGGVNLARDAQPISEGSSIASFGAERILELADQIDVYVSQRGAMNAGGNLHSISIRPGFDTVKAVREGRVYVINEKLISSPTFRYPKGVRELARYLYPQVMDSLAGYDDPRPAARRDLANILVRARHLPIYLPSSSKYYEEERRGHTYGLFADVDWRDEDFDAIETAVHSGAMGWELRGEREYFDPDAPVTRDMAAKALFILGDYAPSQTPLPISDLELCETPAMVQALVDNGVMALEDGAFHPGRTMTCAELAALFTL